MEHYHSPVRKDERTMKKEQQKVSIIVPIYNGAKVLKRCVDSIEKQTYENWELLLINDGSKDESIQICTEYAKKDDRIKVIDKENEGVSATRNRGISEATGSYVHFVDCDDYVTKRHLEDLVTELEKTEADLVISGYTRHKGGQIDIFTPDRKVLQGKEQLATCFFELYNRWFLNTPWNKLYKKEKIDKEFPVELSLGEDLLFNLVYMKNCDRIAVVSEAGYQYCIENDNSLAFQYRKDRFENALLLHEQVIKYAKEYLEMTDENMWQDEAFVKGVRFAMVNLVRAKDVDKITQKRKIEEWTNHPEVRVAYKRCGRITKKDQIFKLLIQFRCSGMLYRLLRIMTR